LATVEHSVLTGSALHEPKGIAAAAANKVYVSDGVGSGSWTTITNPFGSGLLHVRDEKTAGTDPQSLTAGAVVNTRQLNTVKTNEITGASLASNQITLTAGTYHIQAWAPIYLSPQDTSYSSKIYLYNTSTAANILVGRAVTAGCGVAVVGTTGTVFIYNQSDCRVEGRFTLAGTSVLELRQYVNQATTGGKAYSVGSLAEVYSEVMIWKIS